MRILILSWEYTPHVVGGLGAHVNALVPALARAGVDVTLLTPRLQGGKARELLSEISQKRKKRSRKNNGARAVIERITLGPASAQSFFSAAQAANGALEARGRKLFAKNNFDLIHAHDWLVSFAGIALKHAYKTPLLATMHATERGRGHGALGGESALAINSAEWWLTYEAWRVIATSGFMAEEVKKYFHVPADKVEIISNGVDAAPFDALAKISLKSFRRKWARAQERIVFMVGRIVQEKGAQVLLEAAPRVLAEFPETKFIVAGLGGMSDFIRERARELGIAERFLVAGFISDEERNRLFKVADVAVFPSLYEPFGIVALEAMAAKCPVVVSETGGLREVVRHAETGITVYPNDRESLAWGILHTLEHREWARARADNAYRMVKEEYNWDRIAARTVEIYSRVMREREKAKW